MTAGERRALDAASARTGRSIAALIREAVELVYGSVRSTDEDLTTMCTAFGSWEDRGVDGKAWVEEVRSGSRLAAPERTSSPP